jgi:hypothetical protein
MITSGISRDARQQSWAAYVRFVPILLQKAVEAFSGQ